MSRPRRIIFGQTHFITRRCIFGEFFLRPDDKLNDIIGYILAYTAGKTHIRIHAYYFASNHLHLVVTDPQGRLPDFLRELDSLIARAVNCLRRRRGNFWEGDSYNGVELLSDEAILDKITYTITNPVKDLLVPYAHQWPGLISKPGEIGQWKPFKRPKIFFSQRMRMPKEVRLKLVAPPILQTMTEKEWKVMLSQMIEKRETEVREEAMSLGKTFLGRREVLRQSWQKQTKDPSPKRETVPRLATGNTGMIRSAREELLAFYAAYKQALEEFISGVRDVIFPEGTYLMKVRYAVFCGDPSG